MKIAVRRVIHHDTHMADDPTRRRLALATAAAHRAVAKATRSIQRAHRHRIERLNALASAYLAEADAAEDKEASKRLKLHADFALKFVSLTNKEIEALERELKRTELETTVAEARSRGESPALANLKRSAPRQRQQPVTDDLRPGRTRRTAGRTRMTK